METKKKYVIIAIFAIIIVSLVGTIAWLTAKTSKSSLVLILGDYDSLQVTLSPYELKYVADPVLDYTTMDDYVSITAKNNKTNEQDKFNIFYKIEEIDQELASTSMKYIVVQSSDNVTFTKYSEGSFSGAANNMVKIIASVTLSAGETHYYRVYTFLDGRAENRLALQGKSLHTMVSADINPID